MANILINGLNSKIGGGKSILNNYFRLLQDSSNKNNNYFFIVPKINDFNNPSNINIKLIKIKNIFKKRFFLFFTYTIIIPRLIKRNNIDLILNLADIPVKTKTYQLFLFDWPYAAYPDSIAWKRLPIKEFIFKKIKLHIFKSLTQYINALLVQSTIIGNHLSKLYGFDNFKVVPNAVSLDNLTGGEDHYFNLPHGIKLLYLSYYYVHKNFEIFIPLAKAIKEQNLNYKIIITLDPNQHKLSKKFITSIKNQKLNDIIINVGPVEMKHVPSLYKQCDGLLMPTLLESFSGTYVEAMFHKIPIFTSNLDFAVGVCGYGAQYFDPLDETDILRKLNEVFADQKIISQQIFNASNKLESMPDWQKVYNLIDCIINESIEI